MQKIKYFILSTLLLTTGVFTSCNKATVDIMVVGVDHQSFKETNVLIDALENKTEQTIDNLPFYIGQIQNKKVAIAETTFGTSEAAMATTIGIKHFAPKVVISEGSAGGHHDNVHLYDVILGKDILDMASYQGTGSDPSTWRLQNPTLHSNDQLLEVASKVKNVHEGSKVVPNGIISSSDAWNDNKDFINKIHNKFNEDVEEMEAYAVSNVCDNYQIPFLSIKMVSNNLITEEDYDAKVCAAVQEYTIEVIKVI